MHQVNLAVEVPGSSFRWIGWAVRWLVYEYPAVGIPVVIVMAGALLVVVVRMVRRWRASRRVAGSAQVLSVETTTTTDGPDPSYTCRIALRVEIPGRAPYDATSSNGEFLTPAELAAVQPGKTVVVQVNPSDPQDVWIDFNSIG